MPLVSIIVPVYCMEKYLHRCIDSIINQTKSDFELILVDDGSKDNSGRICDEYAEKDARIKVFHKANGGVGSAKNLGIEQARGEYLTFVDSDDFVSPQYLHALLDADKAHTADLIIGGVNYCREGDFVITSSLNLPNLSVLVKDFKTEIPKLLDNRALNYHVAKLYKRSTVEKHNVRFTDFRQTGADDTVFNFEFIKCAEYISVTSENIYNYVIYSNSTSHKYANDKWERSKRLDRILTQISDEMGILTPQMTLSLDNRIILSAIWSANAIIKDSGYNVFKILTKIHQIANDERVSRAKANPKINIPEYGILLLKNHCFRYYFQQAEVANKCKSKIYKYLPQAFKSLLRSYYRWKDDK